MTNPYTSYCFRFPSQSENVPGGKVMVTAKGECSEEDAKVLLMQMQTQYSSYCNSNWKNGNECRFMSHVVKGSANGRESNLSVANNHQKPELVSMIHPSMFVVDEVNRLDMPMGEDQNYMRIQFDDMPKNLSKI
jgi:hypothetical protein